MICKGRGAWRFGAVALAALAAGCANDDLVQDTRFGEAVRYTVALQTADPHRGARGLDGEKAEAGMRAYKEFEKIDRSPKTSINFFGER